MSRTLMQSLVVFAVAVFSSCSAREQQSVTVGSGGGRLALSSGTTLDVPAGALFDDVTITVVETRDAMGEREIEFEPRHHAVAVPVTLSVPDDGSTASWLEGERLEVRRREGRLEVELQHLDGVRFSRRGRGADDDGGVDDRGGNGADDDGGVDDRGGNGADDDGGVDDRGGHGNDDDAGVATGGACVTDDTCACGSECVSGQCTVVVTCTVDADCSGGARCREGRRSGVACGVLVCHL